MTISLRKPTPKAFLVILECRRESKAFLDESLEEMKELVFSAGRAGVGDLQAHVPHPSASHFVREGKLAELRDQAVKAGANVLIFNVDLTPVQTRNIEAFTKIRVMDRTELILDIFGKRAQTSEGKLQVELARLNYMMPRLVGLGTVLSRLGGGIGTRGPGEPELEWDRRKFRRRIEQVKVELERVKKHRRLLREGRKKKNFITAAIVGYTNAGKSTLLNALTGTRAYVADKMFATLDPKTRLQTLNGQKNLLFVDTVGFLRDLPHGLIEAFHATLEEVAEADILIHVLDVSGPRAAECKRAVEKVLEEIQAAAKPAVLALNKADLLKEEEKTRAAALWPEGILISAQAGSGLDLLMKQIGSVLRSAGVTE
jgi:GTP-binding protein HflX